MIAYRLRPSAAATWVKCPGSVLLSAGQSDDGDNTIREEGTACHWAAHMAATGSAVVEGVVAPNGVVIDSDMLDAVDTYIAAIAAWPTPATRHFEQFVRCAGIHEECAGTPDVFAYDDNTGTMYIGDLKYGFKPVSAESNWQLLCYADGVRRYLFAQPKRYVFMICQPRAFGTGGQVRSWSASAAEVAGLQGYLQAAADIAVGKHPTCQTNPGCTHCAGRHRCTALQNAALDALDATHAATPDDLTFTGAENELRLLQWARGIVDARISGLEQQVTHGIKHGQPSRHFEVAPTQSRLTWNAGSERQIVGLATLLGVDVHKPPQLITPTQAIKKLGVNFVNMHAQRLANGAKLVQSDASKWTRIFGEK